MSIQVKEVHSDSFFLQGAKYLEHNFPANALVMASYDGWSTFNLATSILFDRTENVTNAISYLQQPKRYIAIEGTEIVGAMTIIALPEFGPELDFETYVIIDADTQRSYTALLSFVEQSKKLEVVAYRPEHLTWVYDEFDISLESIHKWKLFYLGNIEFDTLDNIRIATPGDLTLSKQIPSSLPIERSPFRSLHFQFANLPYLNFVYPAIGTPELLVGIRKYCSLVWEIHYMIGNSFDDTLFENMKMVIQHAVSEAMKQSPGIIWRLRADEYVRYELLLKELGFDCLVDEHHLHIRTIEKRGKDRCH